MFTIISDEQLIKNALGGSERAWLALVKRYEKRLYNYSLRLCGNPDDARDILQDVFLAVYRNLANYRGEGSFAGWMFRIAAFRSTDFFRKRQPGASALEAGDDVLDDSLTYLPEAVLDRHQGNVDIMLKLRQLTNDQRQVVELKFFQHFTFEEISGQLGIPTNTAKTRLYSALRKLREAEPAADAHALKTQAGDPR